MNSRNALSGRRRTLGTTCGGRTSCHSAGTGKNAGTREGTACRRRVYGAVAAFVGGALAAGLGLGALAVIVLFLWITSPFPDSGPNGALHVAAGLWLLAHGADLVRTDTAVGAPAAVGLTPLLLTVLPLWLLNRAGAHATEPEEQPDQRSGQPQGHQVAGRDGCEASARAISAPAAVVCLTIGYCAVAAAILVYTSAAPIRSRATPALVLLPLIALLAAGAGAWAGCGRPGRRPAAEARATARRVPVRSAALLPAAAWRVVLRAAAAGTFALVVGGLVITSAAVVRNASAVNASFVGLTDALSGKFAVLLLCAALAPNAAVWGASYALAPGFSVGSGTAVAPTGTRYSQLPDLPLLAALPEPGVGGPLNWATLLVPVVAGAVTTIVVAGRAARGAPGERWTGPQTAAVAVLASAGVSAAMAALTALASGPVGSGRLAEFGPSWSAVAVAALCWTAGISVPGVLLVRRRKPRALVTRN